MPSWRPQSSSGRWIAAVLLGLALSGTLVAALRLAQAFSGSPETWPIDSRLFLWLLACVVLLAVSGWLAYRLFAALTLAYQLDRNGLYIRWLGNRAIIPLDQISAIDIGAPGARLPLRPLQGIGTYWGRGRTSNGRPLYLFATRPLSQCLLIHTGTDSYAISPRDQDTFVQDLEQRRSLGATKTLHAQVESGRLISYAFWSDPVVALALALTLLLHLALLAFLFVRYPTLAPSLPMQFNLAGSAVGFRPKYQIFLLPLAAFCLTLLNAGLGIWLYRREQIGARLLQVSSLLVHLLFAIACVTIAIGRTRS
jgi:hypothetical protein